MKKVLTIACAATKDSLNGFELVAEKLLSHFPGIELRRKIVDASGSLSITLNDCQADLAVYCPSAVGGIALPGNNTFRVVSRGLLNDVVFFRKDIISALKAGREIRLSNSSATCIQMTTAFLEKALPRLSKRDPLIKLEHTDEDVRVAISNLALQSYDGHICSVDYINWMLENGEGGTNLRLLLNETLMMVLPLFECPPPAGRSAVVVACNSSAAGLVEIVKLVGDKKLTANLQLEIQLRQKYTGAREVGVFHIDKESTSFTYAAGIDEIDQPFTDWQFPGPETVDGTVFSSTDYMKDFFNYSFIDDVKLDQNARIVFISSQKAVHSQNLINQMQAKRTWAAGTKTWFDLSRKGIWVEGSADGLGLGFLDTVFSSALVSTPKDGIQILTNASSTSHWKEEGWNALASYELLPHLPQHVKDDISHAPVIFWTSFQQYQLCKPYLQQKVQHLCPAGKTARLLKAGGLNPFVFPTIKAFTSWRTRHTTPTADE